MEKTMGRAGLSIDEKAGVITLKNPSGLDCWHFKVDPWSDFVEDSVECGKRSLEFIEEKDGLFHWRSTDSLLKREIFLRVRENDADYHVEIEPAGDPVDIRCVHYGQDGPGIENASRHNLQECFVLSPDRYGSAIPSTGKMVFKLGVPSFRFDLDNNFPHEGGRAIISPYAAALRTGDEWMGIGTLEIPACEYGLNLFFDMGRVRADWYYGSNLKLSGIMKLPKITFYFGQDKLSVINAYIQRLYDDNLAHPPAKWHSDWAGPIYCFFSDQMYAYQLERKTAAMQGEMTMTEEYCNEDFLDRCTDFLEKKAIEYGTVIIDYGWSERNGQWTPNEKRFRDFAASIKKLQSMGKKVLAWYSPYFMAEESEHYRENPGVVVRKENGDPFFTVRFGIEKNFQSDFTHPAMRDMVRRDFEFILGPGGLNCDGIKVDCTHQPPVIDNIFHDPSWGTGEMFHYRASKFMYDLAHEIKPDCCINATAGNPLFNNTFDLHRIHDAMEYNIHGYEERAWAAWFCRAGVCDLDDWPSYDIFTVRSNLRKIAYGVPSLYAAMARGVARKPKSSWGYSMKVRDDELELLGLFYRMYRRVPVDLEQEITIDPFSKVFCRKYASGPLKDFYACTTLAGNQAVAVFEPGRAVVASINEEWLAVPLPPDTGAVSVARVNRNGTKDTVESLKRADEILFRAQRCSGDVDHYLVEWER